MMAISSKNTATMFYCNTALASGYYNKTRLIGNLSYSIFGPKKYVQIKKNLKIEIILFKPKFMGVVLPREIISS